MNKKKKAQIVLFSIMFGLFLFLLVLLIFFDSIITRPVLLRDHLEILKIEATRLSDTILLPGYPENWHEEESIQRIGLTDNGILSLSKLNKLANLANTDYAKTKILLGIQNDYYVNISYGLKEIIISNITNNAFPDTKHIITRERIALINNTTHIIPAKILIVLYTK